MRRVYRRSVPSPVRQRVRRVIREIPIRMRDLPGDLVRRDVPPARLRARVGATSSRAEFLDVGRRAAAEILAAAGRDGHWLDFGCGCGRVARHLTVEQLTGVDVDRNAVRWCARHLRGEFVAIGPMPPAPFAAASFDVVCAVSVFTHFDEAAQDAWLAELQRLLRPGGLLVASTHGADLAFSRPDLTAEDHGRLRERGFVFRKGIGPFNEDSAFHTRDYLEREWSRRFEPVSFVPFGLTGYLDLSVWRGR